ncbi:MAG: HAD-IIIC family phosphatase [Crocosphaera sp.]|nr:HAD-IIIC family phosphatase [Crocosphaera sp.]
MKLLFTMNNPYRRIDGGANKTIQALAESLAARDNVIKLVAPALTTPSQVTHEEFIQTLVDEGLELTQSDVATIFNLNNIEVHAVRDSSNLRDYLIEQTKDFQPDWVIVSAEDASQNLLLAALQSSRDRVIYICNTIQMLPFGPASYYPGEERTKIIGQTAAILTCADFVAEYIKKWSGFNVFVNRPPRFGKTPFPNHGSFDQGYVLMMNVCDYKGFPIFLSLAKAFPNIQFAALRGWGTTQKERDAIDSQANIHWLPNSYCIDDFFSKTRILLMPSLWIETFGRATVEAMLRGIPVLASNVGGLPEAKLGVDYLLPVNPIEKYTDQLDERMLPIAVLPEQDITPWKEALGNLLTDRALYERISQESRQAALEFVSSLDVAPLEQFLLNLPKKSQLSAQNETNQLSKTDKGSSKTAGDVSSLTPQQQALLMKRLIAKRKSKQKNSKTALSIPIVQSRENLPLSFAQQRLWLLAQLEQQNNTYNMSGAVKLTGVVNRQVLEQSLQEILRRQEALHTTFKIVDNSPVQIIDPKLTITLPLVNLENLSEQQQTREVQKLTEEASNKPFNLSQGPLIRVALLKLAEQEHILIVSIHHIITDGWSMGIFIREVSSVYQAHSNNQPSPLPKLSIQYADFASWQRKWLTGKVLETQLNYWQQHLSGALPFIDLPTDKKRPSVHSLQGSKQSITVSKALSKSLHDLSRQQEVTLFATLMAALKIVLFQWTGQKDLVVGTVVAGRNRQELEPLIGCFMNFLALRSQLSEEQTGQAILKQMGKTVLEAYSHQDCPFEEVVATLNPPRQLGYNPIYNVALLLQNFSSELPFGPKLQAHLLPFSPPSSSLDLRFVVYESSDQLLVECEYNLDLFVPQTIEFLLEAYGSTLEQLVAKPEAKLAEFTLLERLQNQGKLAKNRTGQKTLAITATFTAEPVKESLVFWAQELDLPWNIEFAPYNQVFQQLLNPNSHLSQNQQGANVILVRFEDWLHSDNNDSIPINNYEEIKENIERNVQDLILALRSAAKRSKTPYLVCLCPSSSSWLKVEQQTSLVQQLEERLREELKTISGVYWISSSELEQLYPMADYHIAQEKVVGHVPYTPGGFAALGTMIARKLHNLKQSTYKVIVLDCDQTLWQGICGEDGAEGIEITPPYAALQQFILEQQQQGKLLCLCSKNEEQDVLAVFDFYQSMPLNLSHFVSWRINWQSKSDNLKSLAQELQLGLDSFIFVDDNPVECAEVQANCPEVLTVQLPQDEQQIPQFLKHIWAFDTLKITEEDEERTELYRQNIEREKSRQNTLTFEEFLEGLNLEVTIKPCQPEQLTRISQLTQRTNQFNVTTIRRSETDIQQCCELEQLECLAVKVQDRFGDYGLVGTILFKTQEETMTVDTFLLSCRALGRGVEHQMLAHLAAIAQTKGLKQVEIPYIPTQRNQPAEDFLNQVGKQYGEKTEPGWLFRFPVETINNLSFQRDYQESSDREQLSSSSPTTISQSQTVLIPYAKIAMERQEVEQIREAIESQKQWQKREIQEAFVAPRNSREEKITEIWGEVLKIDQIGVYDNFFALGGSSLLGVQVINRIREIFNLELPFIRLFEQPTVAGIAELIEALQTVESVSSPISQDAEDREEFEL